QGFATCLGSCLSAGLSGRLTCLRGDCEHADMNDRSSRIPGSNRASLFETAIESFAELGFNGASMRTIASRAGMALSNLYNYAPSKQDLLVQILRKANYDHLSATEWAMSGAGKDPADRLAVGVR